MQARLASGGHAHITLLIIAFGQLGEIADRLTTSADTVIAEIARRLRDAAGPEDELARLDEAQFVMLCGTPGARAAETLGARIRQAMREPSAAAPAATSPPRSAMSSPMTPAGST